MKTGHITLHRKIVEWEWYSDVNTCRLFIHLLLTANWQDKFWRGILIKRGDKITSIQHLSEETSLTNKQIRLSLKKLEKTGEIKTKKTNKYTAVTLVKYNDYQTCEEKKGKQEGNEAANKRQTKGKQRATTKPLEELKTLEPLEEKNTLPLDFKSNGREANIFFLPIETDEDCDFDEPINQPENKPLKKTIIKQKESKPNAWAIWIDINRELGRADPFASGKDTKAAKSILSQIQDPEKFKDILRQYLTDDDRFLMQNGHSISFLSSKINKYLNQCYQPKDTYNVGEDPDELAYITALEERIENENKGA